MSKRQRPTEPCEYFCCSNFKHFQEPEADYTADLKNAVHPLFSCIHISNSPSLEEFDTNLLELPLQLATRFLQMETVQRHMLTVYLDERYLIKNDPRHLRRGPKLTRAPPGPHPYLDWPFFVYDRPEPRSTEELAAEAEQHLTNLARMVQIEFVDNSLIWHGVAGKCLPREGPLTVDLDQAFPHGRMSLIQVQSHYLRDLQSFATRQASGVLSEDDLFALRNLHRQLAQILCHELGHANVDAVYGGCISLEPIMNSARCGEAGFDLEAAIFGGIVGHMENVRLPQAVHTDCDDDWVLSPLVLQEWPSDSIICEYINTDLDCSIVAKPKAFTEVTRLPRSFIVGLFHEQFWNKRNKSATLRPSGCPSWIVALEQYTLDVLVGQYWGPFHWPECPVGSKSSTSDTTDPPPDTDGNHTMDTEACTCTFWKPPGGHFMCYRLIDCEDHHLDDDTANRLREIIRRQWVERLSDDPSEIFASAAWPDRPDESEEAELYPDLSSLWHLTNRPNSLRGEKEPAESDLEGENDAQDGSEDDEDQAEHDSEDITRSDTGVLDDTMGGWSWSSYTP